MTFSVNVGKSPANAVAEESRIADGIVRRRRYIKLLQGVFLRGKKIAWAIRGNLRSLKLP
jgi:hypothetical protein